MDIVRPTSQSITIEPYTVNYRYTRGFGNKIIDSQSKLKERVLAATLIIFSLIAETLRNLINIPFNAGIWVINKVNISKTNEEIAKEATVPIIVKTEDKDVAAAVEAVLQRYSSALKPRDEVIQKISDFIDEVKSMGVKRQESTDFSDDELESIGSAPDECHEASAPREEAVSRERLIDSEENGETSESTSGEGSLHASQAEILQYHQENMGKTAEISDIEEPPQLEGSNETTEELPKYEEGEAPAGPLVYEPAEEADVEIYDLGANSDDEPGAPSPMPIYPMLPVH
jgi:hypothetical protein